MGTIADGNVIEADDVLSSMRTTAEAGESITIGKACYIKESDGKAYLSDKSSAPYFTGIAYAGVDSGADVTLVTKGKFVTTGLVDKEVYYLGSSGAISTTKSDIRIGSADGTTDLYIDLATSNQGANHINMYAGNYNGDGTTSLAITGVGFTPISLLIGRTNGAVDAKWVTASHAGIVSFDSDGFTVTDQGSNSDFNTGTNYSYIAFR